MPIQYFVFILLLRQLAYGPDSLVHLVLGVEPGEAEPDRPPVRGAQGPVHPGGAVGPGAGGPPLLADLMCMMPSSVLKNSVRP